MQIHISLEDGVAIYMQIVRQVRYLVAAGRMGVGEQLPPVRKSISLAAAWRVGAVLEVLYAALRLKAEPPMTRFLAAQLATHPYFDITRAREDFGYRPAVSTAEGMKRLGEALGG